MTRRNHHSWVRREKGIALLLALLVVAMATLLATRLMVAQDRFVTLTQVERDLLQAQQISRAGLDWARAILLDDMMTNDVDHPGELWGQVVPPLDAEGGKISGRLHDAQARFNINSLISRMNTIDRSMLAAYVRLLEAAGADASLGPRLAEWMQFAGQEKARREGLATMPGGRLWFSLADLEQVSGYTPAVIDQLSPHLVALPVRTPINVNTADVIVLAATGLSPAEAVMAVETRQRNWFRNEGDFIERTKPHEFVSGLIATGSRFFEVQVAVQYRDVRLKTTALLRRQPARGRIDIIATRHGGE